MGAAGGARGERSSAGGVGTVREVALLFARLGVIGFGGPAAHIALMREEVVRRRGWLDDAEFLDLVGATNLVPGPNSTELAIHLGHQRAGWRGLVAAGVCFIGPAVVIVGFLAWLYREHGTDPAVVDLRYGILPVIIAIAGHALVGLGQTALATHTVLYGSGYVLLAFLQRHLVDGLGWLTSRQLLDAIAVGQFTPGPVFTTATFVGWQVDGPAGAAVATLGIFAPSFVFVALLGRIVPWTRARPTARAFLGGVTAASLGLMAGVLVELADAALVDAPTVAIAVVSLAVLVRTRVNSAWLVAAGVVIGALHAAVV